MALTLSRVVADIDANTRDFDRGINRSARRIRSFKTVATAAFIAVGGGAIAAAGSIGVIETAAGAAGLAISVLGTVASAAAVGVVGAMSLAAGGLAAIAITARASTEKMEKRFEEFGKNVSSHMRDFSKSWDGVLETFMDQTMQVIHNLESEFRDAFDSMAAIAEGAIGAGHDFATVFGRRALPALEDMNETFETMFDLAGELGVAFGDSFGRLADLVADIGPGVVEELMRAIERGVPAFTEWVAQLATLGAEILPDVLPMLGRITGAFGDLINQLLASGDLQVILSGFASFIETLGGALGDLFEILGGFAGRAMDNLGMVIEDLGTGLEIIARVVARMGPTVNAVFSSLGDSLIVLGGALAEIVRGVGPALPEVFGALNDVIRVLAPVMVTLSRAFADLLPSLRPALRAFARLVSAVSPAIAPLGALLTHAIDLATVFMENLLPAVELMVDRTLLPALSAFVSTLISEIEPRVVAELAVSLGDAAVAVLTLLPPLVELTTWIGSGLNGVLIEASGLAKAVTFLITGIALTIQGLLKGLDEVGRGVEGVLRIIDRVPGYDIDVSTAGAVEALQRMGTVAGEEFDRLARQSDRILREMENMDSGVSTSTLGVSSSVTSMSGTSVSEMGSMGSVVAGTRSDIRKHLGGVRGQFRTTRKAVGRDVGSMGETIGRETSVATALALENARSMRTGIDRSTSVASQLAQANAVAMRRGTSRESDIMRAQVTGTMGSMARESGQLSSLTGSNVAGGLAAKRPAVFRSGMGIKDAMISPTAAALGEARGIGLGIGEEIAIGMRLNIDRVERAARAVMNAGVDAAKGVLGVSSPSSVFEWLGRMATEGFAKGVRSGAWGMRDHVMSQFDFAGLGGSGVRRWSPVAAQALKMLGQPLSYLDEVLSIIRHESGGNPRAINLTDVNAARGDPSRGLVQTIGSTFNAYAGPLRGRGIYDPLANIFAGLNYGISRYGSIGNIPAIHGDPYDIGGMLPTGTSLVRNQTGSPEPVLTGEQWSTMHSLARRGASGSRTVVLEVDGRELARLVEDERGNVRQVQTAGRA